MLGLTNKQTNQLKPASSSESPTSPGRGYPSRPKLLTWLPVVWVLLPLIFLLLFYFYPLAAIFQVSFGASQFEGDLLQRLISTDYYGQTLWFTVWQAALSTLLTVGLALPGAYIFAHYHFPGKTILRALTTIPFVLPTIVVANAFTALLGPKGVLNSWAMSLWAFDDPPIQLQRTLSLILMAHVFYNYTIVLRLVGGFWANLDPRLPEAARMLGLSSWQAFRQVTLPLLMPAVAAAALLVYIFCFTSFGVVLILGGPQFATLEVEIYRQAVNLFNLPLAGLLSLIQLLIIFGLMMAYTYLQARTSRPLDWQSSESSQRRPQSWPEWLLVWGNVGLMVVMLGTPLVALILRSVTVAGELSLNYYAALFAEQTNRSLLFVPPSEAVRNSLMFALSTVIVATGLGLLTAVTLSQSPRHRLMALVSRLLDAVFMLPLATSAVTLGFGYIITMGHAPFSWVNLRTSPVLVVIAHTLVALPFVVRSVLPALRSIQPRLREAATVLGASPLQVWWAIDWPIASRALLVGAVFAFTISMGEFGATLFIARPDTPTMPTAIFRLLGQPGALNYGQALAMSSLLMVVCGLGFVIIERFRVGNREEF